MFLILIGAGLILAATVLSVVLLRTPRAPAAPTERREAVEIPGVGGVPSLGLDDDDPDITRVGSQDARARLDAAGANRTLPRIELKWLEADARHDVPTNPSPLILVSAAAQTDTGKKRRANEDRFLLLDKHAVYAVADGMGGHERGDVASELAIRTLETAFTTDTFTPKSNAELPRRADELVRAVQMSNAAVLAESGAAKEMGTTLVCARFALEKKRLYVANVGDSRCYRFRDGKLVQLTTDHTFGEAGAEGALSGLLSRAIGIDRRVRIDVSLEEPRANDLYLLCSDGLTKMVSHERIEGLLSRDGALTDVVNGLVDEANKLGGRDNITVVLVRVQVP